MRRTLIGVLGALALTAIPAAPALAAHESMNQAVFAPTAAAPPGASGTATINYVAGRSAEEPFTFWTSRIRVRDLTPDTLYNVVALAPPPMETVLNTRKFCTFKTNSRGDGVCTQQFFTLRALARLQVRTYDGVPANPAPSPAGDVAGGTPVLQAVRVPPKVIDDNATGGDVRPGPGQIVSTGGCREPDPTATNKNCL